MGTHLRVLSKSYPMNANMTGFKWFSKLLHSCFFDESSLSIGKVKSTVFLWGNLRYEWIDICIFHQQDEIGGLEIVLQITSRGQHQTEVSVLWFM